MTNDSKSPQNKSHYLWLAIIVALFVAAGYFQNNWQVEKNRLTDSLEDTLSLNDALQEQLEASNQTNAALKSRASAAQSDQASLNTVVEQLREALDELQKEQALSSKTLHDREVALAAQKATTQALQTQLEDTTRQFQVQKSLYEKLSQQYQNQLVRLSEMSQSHQSIESQYLNAREQIALQQTETENYSATIAELELALAAENTAMEELSDLLSQMTESNQELVTKLENGSTMIELPERVLFQSGSAKINTQGQQTLTLLVNALKSFPDHIISVQGHSDSRPITAKLMAQYPSNWELSAARAAAAVRILLDQGISNARLQAVGFADSKPLVKEVNDATRAQNRRIEILLVPQLRLKSQFTSE